MDQQIDIGDRLRRSEWWGGPQINELFHVRHECGER
jgi:hypothetical protein